VIKHAARLESAIHRIALFYFILIVQYRRYPEQRFAAWGEVESKLQVLRASCLFVSDERGAEVFSRVVLNGTKH